MVQIMRIWKIKPTSNMGILEAHEIVTSFMGHVQRVLLHVFS